MWLKNNTPHVDWSHFTYLTAKPNGSSVHCSSLGPFILPRQFLPIFSSNLHHLLSHSVLAEDLASYFTGKILAIRKYFHKLLFIN